MNNDKKSIADKLRGWLCRIIGILQEWTSAILAILGIVMVGVFFLVMAFDWISCFFQKGFGSANKKETLEFIALGIGGIFALYGLVALNKLRGWLCQVIGKLRGWLCQIIGKLKRNVSTIIFILGFFMVAFFIAVMFFDYISCVFQKWFGISDISDISGKSGKSGKKETLEFLSLGIGGVIALYGLVALNKRAEAQVETNTVTGKGQVQDRFKAAVDHLSNNEPSARIASFYEFFHLAKDKEYIESILDILCAHLRHISSSKKPEEKSSEEKSPKEKAPEEKAPKEKSSEEKAPKEKAPEEKLSEEKSSEEKAPKEKAPEEKPSEEKAPKEKAPEEKPSEEKASEEIKTLIGILFSKDAVEVFGKLDYDLQRVNLNGIDFQKMHKPKRKVDFSFAKLVKANFIKRDLSGFNFQGAKLEEANLERARLIEANLFNANLERARLFRARLFNANLEKARLFEANLERARLFKANLKEANLEKACLFEAHLFNANLKEANLKEANLEKAHFFRAHLFKANLKKANLKKANLKEARLWDANLERANLFNTNLKKADLWDANLSGASAYKADLQGANLQGANLREASLRGADLRETRNLKTAVLSEAEYDDETKFPEGFDPASHGMVKYNEEDE